MGMCVKVHASFAAISWSRGFPVIDCHRQWNMGVPLQNLQADIKAWSGNTSWPRTNKFKSMSSAGKVMLMLFWDSTGAILCLHLVHGQSIVHGIVLCLKKSWNLLFAVNAECWQMELCIMTMVDLIWQQWTLKGYENWNSSSSPTKHTVISDYHTFRLFKDALHRHQFAKWWRCQGHRAYVASHETENIIHRWHQEAHGVR